MNKCVFLDRDGTIIENIPYLNDPEKVRLTPFAGPAIKLLNDSGFKVIVISNQSGIGRGLITEEQYTLVNKRMFELLDADLAGVNCIYHCPHKPEDACGCRKPRTNLFRRAVEDYDIDLRWAYMVGDSESDIEAGYRLGIRVVFIGKEWNVPHFQCENLLQAVSWILEDYRWRLESTLTNLFQS